MLSVIIIFCFHPINAPSYGKKLSKPFSTFMLSVRKEETSEPRKLRLGLFDNPFLFNICEQKYTIRRM